MNVDSISCSNHAQASFESTPSPKFLKSVGALRIRRYELKSAYDDEGIDNVSSLCYPPDLEEDDSFRAKLVVGDSFVAVDSSSNQIVAYCIGLPWHKEPFPINESPTQQKLVGADVYVVHDVAVHPEYRRSGVSSVLLNLLFDCARARKLKKMVLIQLIEHTSILTRRIFLCLVCVCVCL